MLINTSILILNELYYGKVDIWIRIHRLITIFTLFKNHTLRDRAGGGGGAQRRRGRGRGRKSHFSIYETLYMVRDKSSTGIN